MAGSSEVLVAGFDAGASATKAVLCDPEKDWAIIYSQTLCPGLESLHPGDWMRLIRRVLEEAGTSENKVGATGFSVSLPIVNGTMRDPSHKTQGLDGKTSDQVRKELQAPWPTDFLHDAASHLMNQIAVDPLASSGTAGLLAFGGSIGLGITVNGEPMMRPWTAWPSHIQLRPGFRDAGPCPACKQEGCWRAIYKSLSGNAEEPKTDRLLDLVEVTAQGIAAVLCVLPMARLFIGGGWAKHFLNPDTCLPAVRSLQPYNNLMAQLGSRLGEIIEPDRLIRFAQGGEYSGAVGAARFAWQTL